MSGHVHRVGPSVHHAHLLGFAILTQLSAIISAARSTGLLVLADHIRVCVMGLCRHGHENQEEILAELTQAIDRFTRAAG